MMYEPSPSGGPQLQKHEQQEHQREIQWVQPLRLSVSQLHALSSFGVLWTSLSVASGMQATSCVPHER